MRALEGVSFPIVRGEFSAAERDDFVPYFSKSVPQRLRHVIKAFSARLKPSPSSIEALSTACSGLALAGGARFRLLGPEPSRR
jgi:hypothetical protein